MGLLNKAKAKAAETSKNTSRAKKQTVWVTNSAETAAVDHAIKELVRLESERKRVAAQQEPLKAQVKRYAENRFFQDYVAQETMPETPMVLQSSDGDRVTFVVQDRSSQHKVSDEQKEQLALLFGEGALQDLIYEEHEFGLNRDVLAVEGVADIVEEALERAQKAIVEAGLLDEDTAEALVTATQKTSFRPDILQRLFQKSGKDTSRFRTAVEVAGSAITRYPKL